MRKEILNDGKPFYYKKVQILFEKKSDARKFVKITKKDFSLASRNANFYQLTFGNTKLGEAVEYFLIFQKHFEEIKKVAKIIWFNID